MLGWISRARARRAVRRALVEADAADLIERHGNAAYHVAKDRDRAERDRTILDQNRPARHWSRVKLRIAEMTGREVGDDTASRYLRAP